MNRIRSGQGLRDDADEFFIGYEPPMPPRLARCVARAVTSIVCLVLVWAAVLTAGHVPVQGGTFEFGHPMAFTGTVVEHPYPALQLEAAGSGAPLRLLLVAPGKHGADALVRGLNGRRPRSRAREFDGTEGR